MGQERRRHPRRRVSLPVEVRFLAEEETFSPFQFNACVADMSVAGAMITIGDVAVEQYDVLFRRPRFLRLSCRMPPNDRSLVLFGRVVWHEYCADANPAFCRTAVAFEPLDADDLRRLAAFLDEQAEST